MRNAINSVPLFLYISLSGILLTRFLSSGIRFQESKISFHTLTTTDEAWMGEIELMQQVLEPWREEKGQDKADHYRERGEAGAAALGNSGCALDICCGG